MRSAVVAVIVCTFAGAVGCGGSSGPSPQDAEAHVRAELEAQGEGINVRSVYCEEGSGDRFECEVSYSVLGTGQRTERVLVDEAEL